MDVRVQALLAERFMASHLLDDLLSDCVALDGVGVGALELRPLEVL